jgi:hypothetical protein
MHPVRLRRLAEPADEIALEALGLRAPVSVSGSKNFERDAFYAWLISPEVAQAEIARERGGI